MSEQPEFVIQAGFPEPLRGAAAKIYFEAFDGKLGGILGRDGRGVGFVEKVIDPHYAICAVSEDDSQLLGIAGFKTADGAMVGGTLRDLASIYGWLGAIWRGLVLSVLERDPKPEEFLMDGIAVAQSARGKGVGSALLDAIVTEAKRREMAEIRLDVINTNPRAKALYERKGFIAGSVESTGPFRTVFGFDSATRMVRALSSGNP